jgi:photosystem II stability/assembly factor-like uncharacterized protein
MDEHQVRRRIRRAIDPGPGFPAPMLWERAVSRLDEPAEPRRRPWQAISLAALLLCVVAVAGGLRLSRSVQSPDQSRAATVAPAAAPTPQPSPPAPASPPASTRPGAGLVQFVSANDGWLVEYGAGTTDRVLRTADGGATWAVAGALTGVSETSTLQFFDDHQGLVIDAGPTLGLRVSSTADAGAHWQTVTAPATVGAVRSASFTSMSEGWLLTGPPDIGATMSVYHTSDGGHSWALLSGPATQPLLASLGAKGTIQFASPQNGWIEAFEADPTKETLLATHDGGHTWQTVDLPPPPGASMAGKRLTAYMPSLFGQDGAMLAGLNGTMYLYETHDGGRTWSFGRSVEQLGLLFMDANHWYAQNLATGALTITDDGGATWTTRPTPQSVGWYFLPTSFIGQDGWGILTGHGGYAVYRTTDDGAHWSEGQLPPA